MRQETVSVTLFCVVSILILWVVVGYPLFVFLLLRLRGGKPIARGSLQPTVDIIIPVRNGERWLSAKLDSLRGQDYSPDLINILVVSDGSTDYTAAVAKAAASQFRSLAVLELPPGGKAVALNHAFAKTSSEIILLTDVRQPLANDCVRQLVATFADPEVGTVSGELRIRGTGGEEMVSAYWRMETRLRHALSSLDSMLGATGPIYAIRRSLIRPIPPGTILDDMYLPLGAFFRGFRLVSQPLAVAWDEPMDLKTEFQRKVRTLAGNYQLIAREPRVLSPLKNRMWGHYLSYKVGRLLLPHLLISCLVISFLLPASVRVPIIAAQFIAYAIAAIDPVIPASIVVSRISRPLRTFITMVVAAFLAQKIFFVRADRLWVPTRTK